MSQEHPPTTGLKVRRWTPHEIFNLLTIPFRRKVIGSLAKGGLKTGDELNGASGQRSVTCRKQLTELCKAGILIKQKNPAHGRNPLYRLSPDIAVYEMDGFRTVNFGGCTLRFPK